MKFQERFVSHEREYLMVSISSVMEEFFEPGFISSFHGTFVRMFHIVRDGRFYHFQLDSDRERVARRFLRGIARYGYDYKEHRRIFYTLMRRYQTLMKTPTRAFTLTTLLQLFELYRRIIPYAYAGFDTFDYIDDLPIALRPTYSTWVKTVRRKAETVYKVGETRFMPRYLAWLVRQVGKPYTVDLLAMLLESEYVSFVQRGTPLPSAQELQRRHRFMLVDMGRPYKLRVYVGRRAKVVAKQNHLLEDLDRKISGVSELRGVTAFPGLARGSVTIIRRVSDMAAFRHGNIIVSQMTQPQFLPIMKKAAAFVTDEGGLLSHAAIVAREMKKPCVIGTKIATKVFKDGDRVEVDATKGIVRKVSS